MTTTVIESIVQNVMKYTKRVHHSLKLVGDPNPQEQRVAVCRNGSNSKGMDIEGVFSLYPRYSPKQLRRINLMGMIKHDLSSENTKLVDWPNKISKNKYLAIQKAFLTEGMI